MKFGIICLIFIYGKQKGNKTNPCKTTNKTFCVQISWDQMGIQPRQWETEGISFPSSGISCGLKRGLAFGNTLILEYQQSLEYLGNVLQIHLELIKTEESLLLLALCILGINYFIAIPGFSCLEEGSRSEKKKICEIWEKSLR